MCAESVPWWGYLLMALGVCTLVSFALMVILFTQYLHFNKDDLPGGHYTVLDVVDNNEERA